MATSDIIDDLACFTVFTVSFKHIDLPFIIHQKCSSSTKKTFLNMLSWNKSDRVFDGVGCMRTNNLEISGFCRFYRFVNWLVKLIDFSTLNLPYIYLGSIQCKYWWQIWSILYDGNIKNHFEKYPLQSMFDQILLAHSIRIRL